MRHATNCICKECEEKRRERTPQTHAPKPNDAILKLRKQLIDFMLFDLQTTAEDAYRFEEKFDELVDKLGIQ